MVIFWSIALIIAGLILIIGIGWSLFALLVQSGVIIQKAVEPPTHDTHDYRLEQGREVKSEDGL